MHDAEQEYPHHQPHNGNRRQEIFDDQTEPGSGGKEQRTYRQGRQSLRTRQRSGDTTPGLPQGRLRNALIAGVIAGVLCSAESIIIVFANTSNYQQASRFATDKLPVSLAFTLLGVACLTFFIGLLICLMAGYITGKVAVQRRLGFLTGFIAGVITYGISFLLNYIPNYPGHIASTATANPGTIIGSIIVVVIFFLIWGALAGLVSLLGTWLATRHHPYYVEY